MSQRFDVAVVGAGVFGAWTAWHLRRRGLSVALVEAHGPGHSRASSGGETRVIRMGYGSHEIYTRWSVRSLELWKELAVRARDRLFRETGVLWMAREQDPLSVSTAETLLRVGIPHDRLDRGELERRWPQIDFGEVPWAIYEPGSGVLMARRAVQRVVADVVADGVTYVRAAVAPPNPGGGRLESIDASGAPLSAATFVFACGPWLPGSSPTLLGGRIFATRQEVFYFGTRPGDLSFAPPAMPVWIDFIDEFYALPDLEGRGLKFGLDRHGPSIDVGRRRSAHQPGDVCRHPRAGGAAAARAARGAHRRHRGLRVREHVERRLRDRPASRARERLAGGRRLRARLQARARRGRARGGAAVRRSRGRARFSLATKSSEKRRLIY